ncbi:metallophosphoesterase [Ruminococcus sp. AF17-6LB]|uniref:metallophosphoesterase n=1 Tax=unclassified Ruminococcus TaxID=2608920 RepID=UPI000E4B4CBD|nr:MULTISPECIES: metallophosphoesterase [unclassified Ruminococcus]RGG72512.1 metallophosphoesterase [Ruminococcus sp. AF17-6LB]RGG74327.1 metallophosphoesterase [Ruminococcus sp. AF17-6]RGG74839.1 metallophosphoesterase [Ruminococcus sp. AF17-24]RGG81201.1 metallophosphoesterase [Ruminococcus sp. AF17-1AC]
MIFLFLLPFYLGVSSYMMFRFFYWMKHCNHRFNWLRFKVPFAVVYLFMALSPVIAFLLPKSAVAIVIRRISTYWIGIMLYSLLYVVLFDLLRLIAKHTKLKNTLLFSRGSVISIGSVVVACAVATCLYGIFNARNIKVNEYSVTVNKSCGSDKHLKAVLVADLHMGYAIGVDHITNMVEKINQQDADIVIIAGDIFDNSYDGMDDPEGIKAQLKSIKSKYGVYAVYGNHDIDEKILMGFTFDWGGKQLNSEKMTNFIKECDIKLINDESVLINDEFYLVGRRDTDKPGTEDGTRTEISELTKDLDKTKPIFVLSHEPDELQKTADAGADIDFSGHTHDGQLFPGNLTIGLFWENPCGMIKKDNMYSIVTSGVGVYGTFMRVGTDAEICSVDIDFAG